MLTERKKLAKRVFRLSSLWRTDRQTDTRVWTKADGWHNGAKSFLSEHSWFNLKNVFMRYFWKSHPITSKPRTILLICTTLYKILTDLDQIEGNPKETSFKTVLLQNWYCPKLDCGGFYPYFDQTCPNFDQLHRNWPRFDTLCDDIISLKGRWICLLMVRNHVKTIARIQIM